MFEKISYLEGKGIYFIYLMNTAKKAGCVCVSSADTVQEQLQEPVVLENYDNKVWLCRNKIMGEVCRFPLMNSD